MLRLYELLTSEQVLTLPIPRAEMANCADKLITLTMGKSKQIGLESELAVLSLKEKLDMLSWSITFLVIGLIAGVLGLSGVAGTATHIAWILFVVFLVLFVVSLVMGRRPPV